MHRALIVPSKYDASTGYLDREGWRHSSRVLGARLKEHGYAVETLQPGPGLVRNLRQALAVEDPLSAVVIVFCGYVLLTEAQEPALLLSDEQVIALRLEQLCSKAARTFGRVLLVIDGVRGSSTRVVQEANPHSLGTSPEDLLAQMTANAIRADNSGMLLSLAPWGAADAGPDRGLCQRLSDILGELDDSQAMSTPELEFRLNRPYEADLQVLCRHSKPAFVFLPARRFQSQPPRGATAASFERAYAVESSVDRHGNREREEDRSAWTPPPDTPRLEARDEGTAATRSSVNPYPAYSPDVHAPPLPGSPKFGTQGVAVPPPLPTEHPSLEERYSRPDRASSSGSASAQLPVRPLGVPPPLPSERANNLQALDRPVVPHATYEVPAVAPSLTTTPRASLPPPVPPPIPSLSAPLPPPLPLPPGLPPPLPSPPQFSPDFAPPPPPVHADVASKASDSDSVTPLQSAALAATPRRDSVPEPRRDSVPEPRRDSVPEPRPLAASAESLSATHPRVRPTPDSNAAPALSGPPPRRHRDSSHLQAAPSLPPLAISPESWRPQGSPPAAPRDEAALLALANAALSQGQTELALQHATQCLNTFPESASALQIVATVLVGEGQFARLADVYDALISALPKAAAAQLCAAAARLWHSQLGNPIAARERLERGLDLDANNASLQRELAFLLDEAGDSAAALHHAFAAVRLNPMSAHAANAVFQRLDVTSAKERTFNVACVLSFLGQASSRVSDVVAAHRSPALPKPSRPLIEDDFQLGLDVTPADPELTRLLAELEPFARLVTLPKAKVQRQLLDSLRAEDVERSTTMLARTFGWSCRLLTLGNPALFVAESDALPTRLPVDQGGFVVGKSLGRGLSLSELVFIWARSLGMARTQTRIVHTLPTAVNIVQFLHAFRCAVGSEQAANSEAKQLVKTIKKLVPAQTLSALTQALMSLTSNYDERVEHWKREADRIANCIGLVACGDPELAARTLDRIPVTDGAPKRQQLTELLSFALSDDYETLRARLGLHLG